MNLTPWMPARAKPTRIGVYETSPAAGGASRYAMWDGNVWRQSAASVDEAAAAAGPSWPFAVAPASWRGLASDPRFTA